MGKIEQISLLSNFKIWFSKMPYFCWVDSGSIFYMSKGLFLQNHHKKICLYVHEKLQGNAFVEIGFKFFIFRPYGFDYLGFLTNTRRVMMRSKTQLVLDRDLNWWHGNKKSNSGKSLGTFRLHGSSWPW